MRQEPRYTTTELEGGPLRDDIARVVDYWTRGALVNRHAIRHLRARGVSGGCPRVRARPGHRHHVLPQRLRGDRSKWTKCYGFTTSGQYPMPQSAPDQE